MSPAIFLRKPATEPRVCCGWVMAPVLDFNFEAMQRCRMFKPVRVWPPKKILKPWNTVKQSVSWPLWVWHFCWLSSPLNCPTTPVAQAQNRAHIAIWNLQSQQSNLENLTARLLSSSHPPTNGITSLQGITRKWLLLPIFTGDCFPSQPWTMPFNTWQVSLVSFLVCPWTSHGLHKELKVSRVDCVDTVDHNGSHISNVSGSFQGHQSADSPDQTGPRIVVPSCCCQLLHPRSIRNIMEYSYVVVASCGWFWLFAASWTDDLRRICRWYSWYGWYVRVVNGTKNWLVNWWYPSRLIHASPQQTVELCLPESGRIHGSTASGSFSQ